MMVHMSSYGTEILPSDLCLFLFSPMALKEKRYHISG